MYKLKLFDYYLPKELIAQKPLDVRENARLMILFRKENRIEHSFFREIYNYFNSGDTLVLNNTKVIPAKLKAKKETGGKIEILLLKNLKENIWQALIKPTKRIRKGTKFILEGGELSGEIIKRNEKGWEIYFSPVNNFFEVIKKIGKLPLPPYIHTELECEEYYQTVYAKKEGSVAAPTAGLHFTNNLLKKIKQKKVNIVYLTLHINIDTFLPVKEEDIRCHKMYSEYFEIPDKTARIINKTKEKGKRIISCGTTTVRALESSAQDKTSISTKSGWTNLYIYPGYKFKIVDSLITNFHFPKSTLLILTSSFAGRELIFRAYKEAIEKNYRFFSFGDTMLII